MTNQNEDILDDLRDSIANSEAALEERVGYELEKTKAGDKALRMLRNAARVGTPTAVRETLHLIVGLAPTEVLEAIRSPLEIAQSFVFIRTGEAIDITR